MAKFFIGFGIGLFVGALFGIMCIALVSANKSDQGK